MSLVSSNTITNYTGLLYQHFNQFKRQIVVHKNPIQTITDVTSNIYGGYDGQNSNPSNYSYIPISGIFYGRIRYEGEKGKDESQPIRQLDIRIPRGAAIIKVESDCSNYIQNGKTERIDVDGKHFNIISDVAIQNYLGLQFYLYTLEGTT